MEKYPIVTSIKIFKEHTLHEDNFISLPFDTPYGNLKLKWIEILQRLDNIDTLIIQLFDEFELINKNKLLFDSNIDELINRYLLFKEKKDYFNHLKELYKYLNG
ncbi:hypothetical protein GFU95_06745 [Apibacter sp. B3889]|uniref:hypothetical protein n=1 Tax=unclassified Apibacter TaxID=2630820 RepID=UPI00132A2BE1|nr:MULTISPECIES: hypothetical protein [unclassified Apibacter]MXO34831.1 hypothetical protein [Apibacter sp. B3883]MXO42065.1 hypothetical protein [Apibacter sp. B3889]MXP03635.1 hypothetical protein [Apibacter sp. B3887]MXP08129.1 hypothetical protein [Apibacter sp. B3935]